MALSNFYRPVGAAAFALLLAGGSASLAWAAVPVPSANPSAEQMAARPDNGDQTDPNAMIHERLLNGPDPTFSVGPDSDLRDGAGETVNPATGTPLPWTVQPD